MRKEIPQCWVEGGRGGYGKNYKKRGNLFFPESRLLRHMERNKISDERRKEGKGAKWTNLERILGDLIEGGRGDRRCKSSQQGCAKRESGAKGGPSQKD